jgi:hypothetical protein
MAVCQNLVPLVNIKIAGKWMFIPLKMVLIGIDPYPYIYNYRHKPFPGKWVVKIWPCFPHTSNWKRLRRVHVGTALPQRRPLLRLKIPPSQVRVASPNRKMLGKPRKPHRKMIDKW